MVIWGWGRETQRDYGPTLPATCPNCYNKVFWRLVRRATWFSLFFIPVLPYQWRHYILCPVCSRGVAVTGHQVEIAKRLNGVTTAYLSHTLTEDAYRANLDALRIFEPELGVARHGPVPSLTARVAGIQRSGQQREEERSDTTAGPKAGVEAAKQHSDAARFCGACGAARAKEEDLFCRSCGSAFEDDVSGEMSAKEFLSALKEAVETSKAQEAAQRDIVQGAVHGAVQERAQLAQAARAARRAKAQQNVPDGKREPKTERAGPVDSGWAEPRLEFFRFLRALGWLIVAFAVLVVTADALAPISLFSDVYGIMLAYAAVVLLTLRGGYRPKIAWLWMLMGPVGWLALLWLRERHVARTRAAAEGG